jgi:hypothetical protein
LLSRRRKSWSNRQKLINSKPKLIRPQGSLLALKKKLQLKTRRKRRERNDLVLKHFKTY